MSPDVVKVLRALSAAAIPMIIAASLAAASWSPLTAAEPAARPADPNAPKALPAAGVPGPRVYTNKDLGRYKVTRGPARVVVDTTMLGQDGKDEAAAQAAGALYPEEKERRLEEMRREIGEAEARIAAIDQRLRSVTNPFLPRPQMSEDEKKAEAGLGARQIQANLQAQRAGLQERINVVRADVDNLIAAPTQPRVTAAPANPSAPPPEPNP